MKQPSKLEQALAEAYPGIDLLAEAKAARVWEIANPDKAKKRHGAFLANWLRGAAKRRAEDRAKAPPARREIKSFGPDGRPVYA